MQLSPPKPFPELPPHPPQQHSSRMIHSQELLNPPVSHPHPQFVAVKSLMEKTSKDFVLQYMICRRLCFAITIFGDGSAGAPRGVLPLVHRCSPGFFSPLSYNIETTRTEAAFWKERCLCRAPLGRIVEMDKVHALLQSEYAYRRNLFGRDVTAAVLDTGVYAGHPDLRGNIVCFQDFIDGRAGAYDDNGHGTHVAGIYCGTGQASDGIYMGMAPLAKVAVLKVLDSRGNGSTGDVVRACSWILRNRERYRIRLVNISVGTLRADRKRENEQLLEAVEELWDKGLAVVAAAGNNGPGAGSITVPGVSRKVITVGSLGDGRRNLYSGRGPTGECVVKPEVVAPGTDIVSCAHYGRGYARKSGTSMSVPVVCGCLALLAQAFPDMGNRDMKLRLYQRAEDTGLPKAVQGWGLVRIPALLEDTY